MTIDEFLLAVAAEDEAAASEILAHDGAFGYAGTLAARLRDDAEVRRRIVAEWAETHSDEYDHCDPATGPRDMYELHDGHAMALSLVLRVLALTDDDHPDYREEWRP